MSAVQFNLLPDVKLHYIKSQRTRNLILSIAIIVTSVAVAVFLILLLTVNVLQKKQLSDADKDVQTSTKQLKAIPNIDKVLTIQNQLQQLSSLHKNKHASSRIFTYLPQVTPSSVKVGSLSIDFAAGTILINGTAGTQHDVNTFVDTLKFTTFKVGEADSNHSAFPSVIESSFSLTNGNASYSLNVQFDTQLFSNDLPSEPKLTVPKLTTTRSVTEDPANALFNGQNGSPSGGAR